MLEKIKCIVAQKKKLETQTIQHLKHISLRHNKPNTYVFKNKIFTVSLRKPKKDIVHKYRFFLNFTGK